MADNSTHAIVDKQSFELSKILCHFYTLDIGSSFAYMEMNLQCYIVNFVFL